MSNSEVTAILRQAAEVRLRTKAAQFEARARAAGWEQALWEGMFAALGYKHNTWPMRRIAELVPKLDADTGNRNSPLDLQARLFGLSGLLPSQVTNRDSTRDRYLRSVWDIWWRERERMAPWVLPNSVWRLHGVRPANHPNRRLALASHWLASRNLLKQLEVWFVKPGSAGAVATSLVTLLQGTHDDFWSRHYTFQSRPLSRTKPLLGPHRATDLAMNVLLPWFWARAKAGEKEELRKTAEVRYFVWPAAQDNALLRLARQRLFGGTSVRIPRRASMQQGMLQIIQDFCNHSNALCEECGFPDLVRHFNV